MNRLQKKAWTELAFCGITTLLVTIPCLLFLAHRNAQGVGYVLICLVVGLPTGLVAYLVQLKKYNQFDEREKEILRQAHSITQSVFVGYLIIFAFSAFFLIGGGGTIDVVILPIMIFAGVFLMQCCMSFIILFQCAKEEDVDAEGGVA